MIIPIKCFTCGKVLADKYRFYEKEVRKIKMNEKLEINKVIYLTDENVDKTPEGIVLDKLKLKKYCCRRHMLTHVEID
jgi:DNA-directed RNA polymerase I, II, and III subunit RPABC5|tara:strand:+ start:37811 stop:38044 length:234 start_codon:yes stop_codon:yes gene_type:complete